MYLVKSSSLEGFIIAFKSMCNNIMEGLCSWVEPLKKAFEKLFKLHKAKNLSKKAFVTGGYNYKCLNLAVHSGVLNSSGFHNHHVNRIRNNC